MTEERTLVPQDLPGFPPGSLPRELLGLEPHLPAWPPFGPRRPAAVMLLLIPPAAPAEPARVVFTRRTTLVGSHKGQVSLAGGRADPGDPSPWATATRELEEELGVPPAAVVPLGAVAASRALDGGSVHVVVGATATPLASMRPSPAEVAEVFALPWTAFTRAAAASFTFNIFGRWGRSYVFAAAGRSIWGLTARVLYTAGMQ